MYYTQIPNDSEEKKNPQIIYPLTKIKVHNNAIFDIEWFDNDKMIASVTGDFSTVLLNTQTYEPEYRLKGHDGTVKWIDSHPSQTNVYVTGGRDGEILLFDIRINSQCKEKDWPNFVSP